ncbi:hypothetical protein V6N11_050609 [Hibiscus sabdariffa]|uniref:Uncharacterized protein n=2 Tax=Hibiscus sabdariffa TaxID=183260 RepID=A0ABR2TAZ6_9ROSI
MNDSPTCIIESNRPMRGVSPVESSMAQPAVTPLESSGQQLLVDAFSRDPNQLELDAGNSNPPCASVSLCDETQRVPVIDDNVTCQ